jgi:hypothetical protein
MILWNPRFCVNNARLPLAIAVDPLGHGRYACANYNIHSASTLIEILRLIA